MKAKLTIKNVGGLFRGEYTFRSGKLNMVESANSSGKTSIVKALTGILSMPESGAFSDQMFGEALKLGIKTDPHNPFEGFVNVHTSQGQVSLEVDGVKEKYIVQQDGDVLETPRQGNEKFLLAGILSGNSRVLRQLRGLDDREPDDFRWAVNELSHAQRYSEVADVLKTSREDFSETLELVKKSISQLEPLEAQQSALERELKVLDSDINTLTNELTATRSQINELVKKRDESRRRIDNWKEEIQKRNIARTKITTTQLTPKLHDLEEAQAQKGDAEAKLEEVRTEIASLAKKEDEKYEIERKVNTLLSERNTIDGMLNLYIMAEANIRDKGSGEVPCPLCQVGSVAYEKVVQNITEFRNQRDVLNSEILQLNQKKQNIAIRLRNLQDQEKSLRDALWEQTERIKFIETQLRKPKEDIGQIDRILNDYRKNIEKEQKIYDELNEEIGARANTALNETFNSKTKLRSEMHEELGRTRQRISELSAFDILGKVFEPQVAEFICTELIGVLNDRISFLEKRAEEEREQASRKFNESINLLLASLGFKEFRTVKLAGPPSYRLYIERYDPERKDYRSQEVGTLSTSEKLAISVILQIALKETYMNDVPFLIIDDVLEDFDSERCEQVVEYLRKKVAKEDWFVIATKLVEELGPPKVSYL